MSDHKALPDRIALRVALLVAVFYCAFVGALYWAVHDVWQVEAAQTSSVSPQMTIPATGDDLVISQSLTIPMDVVEQITLWTNKAGLSGDGTFTVRLTNGDDILFEQTADAADCPNDGAYTITLSQPFTVETDEELTLTITVSATQEGIPLTFAYGKTLDIGRFDLQTQDDLTGLMLNGKAVEGRLYCVISGYNDWAVMRLFFPVAAVIGLLLLILITIPVRQIAHGKNGKMLRVYRFVHRYHYLVERLVSRDFHVKYKRSVFGVLWSFLNPLLTMIVQYIVFSLLFSSAIEYFPVYLLSGIICFNYFNESVSMGLESITGNARLINKVNVPKVIYPVSRVLSSLINLLISLIPLFGVMLLSGTPITKALLLLPVPLFFLIMFCLGVTLLLAASNVFFRDTQFLWGILSLIWLYATPVFYPESIIPTALRTLYHMNPLYQYITFIRSVIINGVSPDPASYLWCILSAVIPLLIGVWVFRKKQDDFILYI